MSAAFRLLLVPAFIVWSSPALALPGELLLDWSYASDPRWSPDGSQLAYTIIETDAEEDRYRSSIWLADLAGESRPLSQPLAGARMPRWHPSGKLLAFLAPDGDATELRIFPASGGESRVLWRYQGRIAGFDWSPTGEAILLQLRETSDEEAGYIISDRLNIRRDGVRGYPTQALAQLGVLTTADSGEPEFRLLDTGERDALSPAWAADGLSVFFVQNVAEDQDRNLQETDILQLALEPDAIPERIVTQPGPDRTPLPSPDGRWLASVGYPASTPPASYRTTEITLTMLQPPSVAAATKSPDRPVEEGATEIAPVTPEKTGELTGAYLYSIADGMASDANAPGLAGRRIQWTADSQSLVFTSAVRGRVQLVSANVMTGDVLPLTRLEQGELSVFDISRSGRVAALLSRPDLPPNIVSFELERAARGAWQQVTTLNQSLLENERLSEYREVTGRHEDGTEVQGWLIAPTRFDRRRRYPLVLYIHGGPHSMYGSNFFFEFQYLASAGYYVLISNPRGSTGYGSDFGNSIQYEYPGKDYEDLMTLLDVVVEDKTIDAERLGVAGGSGGGLLTTWVVGQTDRFKAASAHRSVTNWLSFVGTADRSGFFIDYWFDKLPWADPESYLKRSPISLVDNVKTPVQIIHSDADYRTPLEQSLQYYTALKILDKPAELIVFKDESHGLSRIGRPSNRVERLKRIRAWFDRYLRK